MFKNYYNSLQKLLASGHYSVCQPKFLGEGSLHWGGINSSPKLLPIPKPEPDVDLIDLKGTNFFNGTEMPQIPDFMMSPNLSPLRFDSSQKELLLPEPADTLGTNQILRSLTKKESSDISNDLD